MGYYRPQELRADENSQPGQETLISAALNFNLVSLSVEERQSESEATRTTVN